MINFEELKILRRFETECMLCGYDFYTETITKVGLEKIETNKNYVLINKKDKSFVGRISIETIKRSRIYE